MTNATEETKRVAHNLIMIGLSLEEARKIMFEYRSPRDLTRERKPA